ncbi:molybdopterin molybdenumtransferase MoeA [bacterium]|nr:MAG: molybdopterin molybdenumtransferase MoeA [bacterium]
MIPFPEAHGRILDCVRPLGTETVALQSLSGRVLAQDLVCPFDVPHFDNSQVDGYAVCSTDDGPRKIVGVSAAGVPSSARLREGEAIRIYTGAPMPPGADAVAMQEDARVEVDLLHLDEFVRPGQSVRFRAEEIAAGTTFPTVGAIATPPVVGLAASFGLTQLTVYRRPRVAIVATGDELIQPGQPLLGAQIYASNVWALQSALEALGVGTTVRLVRDDPEATYQALSEALDAANVVLTVGGVSVGDRDLVRRALASLDVEEVFWRVSMKPGKPFYFGQRDEKVIFGLPGNPVSALVTFHVLVRAALRKMLGLTSPEEEFGAPLAIPIERNDLRYEFVRATLSHGTATPVSNQGSHMQTGLAFADCLIHLPDGVASFEAGEHVTVTPLRWS